MDGFNSRYGIAPAAGLRKVTTDWSMYDDDSATLQSLTQKAFAGTPVTFAFQIGTVVGSTGLFTLKNLLLAKPTLDFSGGHRVVAFSVCRVHDTSIGARDAIPIAFQ